MWKQTEVMVLITNTNKVVRVKNEVSSCCNDRSSYTNRDFQVGYCFLFVFDKKENLWRNPHIAKAFNVYHFQIFQKFVNQISAFAFNLCKVSETTPFHSFSHSSILLLYYNMLIKDHMRNVFCFQQNLICIFRNVMQLGNKTSKL